MESKKKKALKSISVLATGTMVLGSMAAMANNTDELFKTEDLGSGQELRNEIINLNSAVDHRFLNNDIELKCGEGTCGEKKAEGKESEKKTEGKAGEGKCGEGTCGGEKAKEGKSKESKAGEGKCGEGTCGGEKAKEGKSGEGKCGEGKCGEGKCGEK